MQYKYRESYSGNIYRKAPDELAESYNFKTGEWKVTQGARDAFYMGDETFRIEPEEVEEEIKRIKEKYNIK